MKNNKMKNKGLSSIVIFDIFKGKIVQKNIATLAN